MHNPSAISPARIERIRIKNYRALKDIDLSDIRPVTVFTGPNGSGKSTILDVFSFLSECICESLRTAVDRRGGIDEMRTRGEKKSISIEIKYREQQKPKSPLITYYLEITHNHGASIIAHEYLQWQRNKPGQGGGASFRFLEFKKREGSAISGEEPDESAIRIDQNLAKPDLLAVSALGQFRDHPRVQALRNFITNWHLSHLMSKDQRGFPEAGPQEHLSKNGANLANVLQYLRENYPDKLEEISSKLRNHIPRLQDVIYKKMEDGRLLLQFKDASFDNPIQARFASDGTIKMLSYLILLYDPNPHSLLGIEEPENFLHPFLLDKLPRNASKHLTLPN